MSETRLGSKVVMARHYYRMNQKTLADKSGLARSLVSRIENGTRTSVSCDTILKLCKALKTDPNYLLGWKGAKHFPFKA